MDSRVTTALNLHVIALLWACLFLEPGGGKATAYGTNHGMPGHQFPRFQKNFWYEYSTPPSTSFPEYIDYHLSPESVTQIPPNSPHLLNPAGMENITAQLGAPARLSCLVKNLQDKTVSWLKRNDDVPILVTFGNSVYIHDVRITVERNRYREGKQEWVLNILNAQKSDQGTYECQISTEPPQIHKVHLYVEAPILTVMDGFGRELVDQYYKVGSSLEVMCTVDRLPARPLPQIIEWRHGNRRLAQENSTLGQIIHTELQGDGAISHLSITQANVKHSGIYTCSVSDTISQSLRLHIIDGEKCATPKCALPFEHTLLDLKCPRWMAYGNHESAKKSKPVPIINNSSVSRSMPNQCHYYTLLLMSLVGNLIGFGMSSLLGNRGFSYQPTWLGHH